MAIGKKPKFYWDTAPLIAWIKDEVRDDPAEMDGLAEVIDLVESNQAILMTSVLWRAEVLDSSLNDVQKSKLTNIFQRRYIQELSIDSRVMLLASEIRNYHKNHPSVEIIKNIRVPDAIHLASAIHYEANEFHTFDGKKPDGKPKGLITLNGNVAGHRIKICSPMAQQLRINFKGEVNEQIDTDGSDETDNDQEE